MEDLPQKQFTLRWEIDWTAHTKEEAARQVLKMLQDPSHTATMFEISLEEDEGDMALVDPLERPPEVKIEYDDGEVHIECPHCGHTESHPADEQRHHLQYFSILKWDPDVEGVNEFSLTSCHGCSREFRLEWDYTVNKKEKES